MSKSHPLVFDVYSIPSSRAKGGAQAQVSTHDEQYISLIYLEFVLFLIQQLNATDTNTSEQQIKTYAQVAQTKQPTKCSMSKLDTQRSAHEIMIGHGGR